jgi:hypothetical protein
LFGVAAGVLALGEVEEIAPARKWRRCQRGPIARSLMPISNDPARVAKGRRSAPSIGQQIGFLTGALREVPRRGECLIGKIDQPTDVAVEFHLSPGSRTEQKETAAVSTGIGGQKPQYSSPRRAASAALLGQGDDALHGVVIAVLPMYDKKTCPRTRRRTSCFEVVRIG